MALSDNLRGSCPRPFRSRSPHIAAPDNVPEMILSSLLDPPVSTLITCAYKNSSDRIQIARVFVGDGLVLERAIFPGQCLRFETEPEALLELYSGETIGALLEDRLSCRHLAVNA